jgi:hypothetical protein
VRWPLAYQQVVAVESVFTAASATRAVTIARMETAAAWHTGGRAAMIESACADTRGSAPGTSGCDAQRSAEGHCRPIDAPYAVGGEKLNYLGDDSLGTIPGTSLTADAPRPGPRGCQPEQKSADDRARLWKRLIVGIKQHERLAMRGIASIFGQRADTPDRQWSNASRRPTRRAPTSRTASVEVVAPSQRRSRSRPPAQPRAPAARRSRMA